ncbi:MAG TPA: ABC transporter permease, partial [Clostridiales bacterium UBA8960]|nr:ABC transporter permease [Clostridiales bacterium UBA8960]
VLGIASVLAITVLQKSRQIGILKAMGINDKVSSLVFLFQGFILGIMGGLLGIIFGLGLLWSFSKFALNADGTPVVPIFINFSFIGLSGLIAVSASTLASIIPALKSRKLSPIEVIKNG